MGPSPRGSRVPPPVPAFPGRAQTKGTCVHVGSTAPSGCSSALTFGAASPHAGDRPLPSGTFFLCFHGSTSGLILGSQVVRNTMAPGRGTGGDEIWPTVLTRSRAPAQLCLPSGTSSRLAQTCWRLGRPHCWLCFPSCLFSALLRPLILGQSRSVPWGSIPALRTHFLGDLNHCRGSEASPHCGHQVWVSPRGSRHLVPTSWLTFST